MNIDGRGLNIEQFEKHVEALKFDGSFKPEFVVIHHCAAPSLAQRPAGFQPVHMQNLRSYYGTELGWSAGPHLFTDDDQVWLFTPINQRGVHAISFNRNGIGIEMLGDYDSEDPWSGRGLNVLTVTAKATAILLKKLGKDVSAIRFHRDDPKTSKTCPGTKISKERFTALVAAAM
jgi:N-acetylmuramoyl-L-alanine amidase CwlA